MKLIKHILSIFIIFIGILIFSEGYHFYIQDFQREFSFTNFYQQEYSKEEMLLDLENTSEKYDLNIFIVKNKVINNYYNEISIYGTKGVLKYLNDNKIIYEKEYNSLFLGETKVIFKNLSEIEDLSSNTFYIIGSFENAEKFKGDLVDKYDGHWVRPGDKNNSYKNLHRAILLLVTLTICLLTYYRIITEKKENVIRISLGENPIRIVLKNILTDIFIYLSIIFISIISLSPYTSTFFNLNITITFFSFLIFINSALYFNIYFYEIKESFSNTVTNKKLLPMSYALKTITLIITILVISSNIGIIAESSSFYKQKGFFEEYKDYYYVNLFKFDFTEEEKVKYGNWKSIGAGIIESFYTQYFNDFNPIILSSDTLTKNGVYANRASLEYISDMIVELKNIDFTKEFYLILNESQLEKESIINQMLHELEFYQRDYNFNREQKDRYEIIYYEQEIDVLTINEDSIYGSKFVSNPNIILDNRDGSLFVIGSEISSIQYYNREVMYKLDMDKFNKFVDEFKLGEEGIGSATNVLEYYDHNWLIAKRLLLINSIFTILVLILEVMITISIIKLEYEINAMEISLKKILGYNLWQKNKPICLATTLIVSVSIVSSCILGIIFNMNSAQYFIYGGVLIFILEIIIIVIYINRIENSKVQKILKGGSL